MSAKILIVDDEADIRTLIRGILEDEGYTVLEASNDETAYETFKAERPDLAILDIWLQNSKHDGIEILKNIKKDFSDLPILMISGHGNIETAVQTIKLGAYDFIEKPFKTDRLLLMIDRALENSALRKENKFLKQKSSVASDLIGETNAIKTVKSKLLGVCNSNSRILLCGESGVGKAVAARFLHDNSDRKHKPFITVHCPSLASSVDYIEKLFGKEAEPPEARQGYLQQAEDGTLLFDEITMLPLDAQSRLVSLFQSNSDYKFKVIATTNKNIENTINSGQFLNDLFHRINIVSIDIPPLRDRLQDIEHFISHFHDIFVNDYGLPECVFSDCAINIFETYEWPGNIRELKNIMEALLIKASTTQIKTIKADDVEQLIFKNVGKASQSMNDNDKDFHVSMFSSMPLRDAREEFEKRYLEAQIRRFGGNISKTSEFIGMERSALHRKLKQLGLTASPNEASINNNDKTGNSGNAAA